MNFHDLFPLKLKWIASDALRFSDRAVSVACIWMGSLFSQGITQDVSQAKSSSSSWKKFLSWYRSILNRGANFSEHVIVRVCVCVCVCVQESVF